MPTPNFLSNVNVNQLADQTVATKGGGDYEPPAKGAGLATLVSYIETGNHNRSFKGQVKEIDEAILVFELSGKKHPPRDVNGTKVPHRIQIKLAIGTNEKSHFFKLFQKLNWKQEFKHMIQCVGQSYRVEVFHDEVPSKKKDAKEGETAIFPVLTNAAGEFAIYPPIMSVPADPSDPECTEFVERPIKVAAPLSQLRGFLWSHADKLQWDSTWIEGDAKTKQVFREAILSANNFKGSLAERLSKGTAEPTLSNVNTSADEDDDLNDL